MAGLQRHKYRKVVMNKHNVSQESQAEFTQYTNCGFIFFSIAVMAMIYYNAICLRNASASIYVYI